ncbi:hypothetical protein RF55_22766, partial [Lasius niger]
MYVPYRCCEKSFEDYYTNQTGHGLNYYQGAAFQKGYGFGGLFRSFFRAAVPLFKSGAKAVGKQLFSSGVGMLNDLSRGEDIKVAAKRHLKQAGQQLTDKAAAKMKTMIGSGRNKKRKRTQKRVSRRKVKKDGGPIEFNISGSGEEYMDLSSSHLYVQVKITKKDGSVLPDNESVAPVNLFLQALFSQVDVSLNERCISSSSNTYPYRAYIETLLNYGEDAKKSLLSCEGFYKDTHLEVVDPLKTPDGNEGLKKRYDLTCKSKTLDLIGQLHCDIFQQNRLLLNLVDLKIKMTRSKPTFCLNAPANDKEYRVILE